MSFSSLKVTSADLAPLLDPHSDSGFHGVYRHRNRWRWTEPFTKRHQTGHRSPEEAARQLVRWWRHYFGENWPDYFRGRIAAPWVVRETDDGWEVILFVKGRPTLIPPPRTPLRDRAAACRYAARRCRERYGANAWRLVRRTAEQTTLETV